MSSNAFNELDRDYTEREDYLASRAEERGAFRSGMTLAEIAEDIAKTRRAIDYIKSVRAPIQAHSKTEYKRLVAQGANALPPIGGARANEGDGMKIELTPAVIACLKRGLNCWAKQNDAEGIEIKEILKQAEEVKAEDV
mgnify:CR=1 FL=1